MRQLIALTFALALPTAALAQSSHLEINPFYSYTTGGELSANVQNLFRDDVKVASSSAWGVTLDVPLGAGFSLEFLGSRQDSHFQNDSGLFDPSGRLADVSVSYLHAGMMWEWTGGQVHPFFVTTLGGTRIDPDVRGASAADRFSGSIGGGVKVFFNRNFGLRFEGRGFWTAVDTGDRNNHCGYNSCYYYNDGFYQLQANAGLIIAF